MYIYKDIFSYLAHLSRETHTHAYYSSNIEIEINACIYIKLQIIKIQGNEFAMLNNNNKIFA